MSSFVLKANGTQVSSPFRRLVSQVSRWFRAPRRPGPSTTEKIADVSSSHAQTEEASAKFWSVYISEAERYDSALVESWRADMEGLLIFSGLFSASLTAFIIESYKNLIPDTGEMTVALLLQVSQQLNAQFSGSQLVISSPPPFEAQTSSLVCNAFWFLSLGLSLTCALLATLVEQWAREFLHKTEIRPSPIRRARVFSFLYYGISRFGIHAIVDIIPLLLHLALVLFFAGLATFLLPINLLMTAIVAGLLAAFLIFYAIITILPAVSLDCPYRTPLSGIFWRSMQYMATLFSLPSTKRSLTDAVLAAAMKRRDIRDERAVFWTLEALTDNTELLPFVEATHDIIYGPSGFRRIDDHLFRLVLQTADSHTSLPRRICGLLWSAETLSLEDPLRSKRQVEGLRALWALGIISARISRLPAETVYGIHEATLQPLTIPIAYRLSVEAVIKYLHLKSIQMRFEDISSMLSMPDISSPRERRRLVRLLQTSVPGLSTDVQHRGLSAPLVHSALGILIRISESDPDDHDSYDNFVYARQRTRDLTAGELFNWRFHFAPIVVDLVVESFRAGVAPYKLLATCEELLPDVPTLPRYLRFADYSLPGGSQENTGALQALLDDSSHNDLDVIMRCGLRLLPLLDAQSFVPTIYWYLTNRSRGADAFSYAFADCNPDALASSIAREVKAEPIISDATLAGITILCLLRPQWMGVLECENIFSLVEEKTESHSAPAYLSLRAILASSMLTSLATKTSGCLMAREEDDLISGAPATSALLQAIVSNPLLHDYSKTIEASISKMDVLDPLLSEISDQYANSFLCLLTQCTAANLPYKAEATVKHICDQDNSLLRSMSEARKLEFAHVLRNLVECARNYDHPQQVVVDRVVRNLWAHIDGELQGVFTKQPSASLLAEARSVYFPR